MLALTPQPLPMKLWITDTAGMCLVSWPDTSTLESSDHLISSLLSAIRSFFSTSLNTGLKQSVMLGEDSDLIYQTFGSIIVALNAPKSEVMPSAYFTLIQQVGRWFMAEFQSRLDESSGIVDVDEFARFYPRLAQLWRILAPNPKQGRKFMSNTVVTQPTTDEFEKLFSDIKHPVERDILSVMYHNGEQTRAQLIAKTKYARSTIFDALSRLKLRKITGWRSVSPVGPGRPKVTFFIRDDFR